MFKKYLILLIVVLVCYSIVRGDEPKIENYPSGKKKSEGEITTALRGEAMVKMGILKQNRGQFCCKGGKESICHEHAKKGSHQRATDHLAEDFRGLID